MITYSMFCNIRIYKLLITLFSDSLLYVISTCTYVLVLNFPDMNSKVCTVTMFVIFHA